MITLIEKIQNNEDLSQDEMQTIMKQIMSGEASADIMEKFLLALRAKGPTVEEITGAATIMREFVVKVPTHHPVILDTCGTGGDKKNTFNISTVSALVVAGAGGVVAKHGNRSVSSTCGSADILEALGVNLNMDPQYLEKCLEDVGIAFLFAQKMHPAMKHVGPVRKALGVETIFNILGPLTNPAQATHQMMGVYHRDFVEPLAHVLKNLGLQKALVVHGADGLDEITTTTVTYAAEYNGSDVQMYEIHPEQFGMAMASDEDLQGGDLEINIQIVRDILDGQSGPKRDIVCLNAAYALYISEIAATVEEGLQKAQESLDTGKARQTLERLVEFTHEHS